MDRAAFLARMSAIIDQIAAQHWRELHRMIHFQAISTEQKRRHAKQKTLLTESQQHG